MKIETRLVKQLKPDPNQPRKSFNKEKLKESAESYKTQGVINPIEIDEHNTIITGELRWRASKIAGLKKVPVIVKKGLSPIQRTERQLVENLNKQDMEIKDVIPQIKLLLNYFNNRTPQEKRELLGIKSSHLSFQKFLANRLGISEQWLCQLLKFEREAPDEVVEMVDEGKISQTHAIKIISKLKGKPKKILSVAKKVSKAEENKGKLIDVLVREGEKKETIPVPKGKFNVIYADPPWKYDFSKDFARSIPVHYPNMETEEICELIEKENIQIADDAILFLWTTTPKLEEALEVIERWGFEYKTNFVWVKNKIGMGYYCRGKHELLLVAKKGNISPPDTKNRPPSVVNAPRGKHSEKPVVVYDMIEKMYPNGKYLELFARERRKKWESWGLDLRCSYGSKKKN